MKAATRWSLIVGAANALCLASVAMFLVYPVRRIEPELLWLVAGLSFAPVLGLVALVLAVVNSTSNHEEPERKTAVRKAELRMKLRELENKP